MSAKSISVYALDVSCRSGAAIAQGAALCARAALDAMVRAPHDELGLVLAGAEGALNTLFTKADEAGPSNTPFTKAENAGGREGRFPHVVVGPPTTASTVGPLLELARRLRAGAPPSRAACDLLETIGLCAGLICAGARGKGTAATIYFITDAKDEVARKEALGAVLEVLRREGIALVVIGVDFCEENENEEEGGWEGLGVKARNERVLRFLCGSLGGRSMVVSLADAVDGLEAGMLRSPIPQRPLLKVVLSVGDIRIATQIFAKTREAKLPALKRTTQAGEAITASFEYRRVVDGGVDGRIVAAEDCIKAFRYGRSRIPITETDLEALRMRGMRSMEALAFVPQDDIPPYIIMGAMKVVLALSGDHVGQKGFAALVRAMVESRKAMIVRFVRMRDANPVLGVCIASSNAKRDALFLGQLPFSDDVSLYSFPGHEEVVCSAEEEQLVASLVDAMTVRKEDLRPNTTFNPFIQQYYEYLRTELKADTSGVKQDLLRGAIPELLPKLRTSSTAFTSPGNPLEPILQSVKESLERCAKAFPYVEVEKVIDIGNLHGSWRKARMDAPKRDMSPTPCESEQAPSTVANTVVMAKEFVPHHHRKLPSSPTPPAKHQPGIPNDSGELRFDLPFAPHDAISS